MSIIHEALKKAGRDNEVHISQKSARGPAQRGLELEYERKKSASSWGFVFTGLAAVLIASPMLATYFASPRKSTGINLTAKGSQLAQTASLPAANRKAQFGMEELPLLGGGHPAMTKRPDLNLTGVVYSPLGSYCIINNKIVKIGEFVDGAKLENVSRQDVTLDYKGEKVVLAVGN